MVPRCTGNESGGRVINPILTNTMLPDISRKFPTRLIKGQEMERMQLSADPGNFPFNIDCIAPRIFGDGQSRKRNTSRRTTCPGRR